jgi:phosphatidylinositol 3,5-bisphosphate 5-phosphatase
MCPGATQAVQRGVLRTNCIDCLDRTNVAQFAAGLAALGRQLAALGISDSPTIDARSSAARHLMDMYEATGNTLARQVQPLAVRVQWFLPHSQRADLLQRPAC